MNALNICIEKQRDYNIRITFEPKKGSLVMSYHTADQPMLRFQRMEQQKSEKEYSRCRHSHDLKQKSSQTCQS